MSLQHVGRDSRNERLFAQSRAHGVPVHSWQGGGGRAFFRPRAQSPVGAHSRHRKLRVHLYHPDAVGVDGLCTDTVMLSELSSLCKAPLFSARDTWPLRRSLQLPALARLLVSMVQLGRFAPAGAGPFAGPAVAVCPHSGGHGQVCVWAQTQPWAQTRLCDPGPLS